MVPIVLNNFNRLSTTRNLCHQLVNLGYNEIYILDNASTYEPLLAWYETQNVAQVEYLPTNVGARAIYDTPFREKLSSEYIVYSDSDIYLNKSTPKDFVEYLIYIKEKYKSPKVGLALKINDLPDNEYANAQKKWEEQFWINYIEGEKYPIYKAHLDNTFSVISRNAQHGYEGIRVAGDFTATHVPWYTDIYNIDEETLHFLERSKQCSTLKRYYEKYIKTN